MSILKDKNEIIIKLEIKLKEQEKAASERIFQE